MTIKQSTIEAITDSKVIMVSFDKYGEKTKISLTWHTADHAYTVEAWAKISHSKYMQIAGYDTLMTVLKPVAFSGSRIAKEDGITAFNEYQKACKAAFSAVCDELAKRTDSVTLGQYITYRKP